MKKLEIEIHYSAQDPAPYNEQLLVWLLIDNEGLIPDLAFLNFSDKRWYYHHLNEDGSHTILDEIVLVWAKIPPIE